MSRNAAFGHQMDLEPVTAHVAAQYHNTHGGSSFLAHSGERVSGGYVVGGHEGVPERVHGHHMISPAQFQAHRDHVRSNATHPRVIAGTWAENGATVMDASTNVHDLSEASSLQAQRGERAVWNASAGREENLL